MKRRWVAAVVVVVIIAAVIFLMQKKPVKNGIATPASGGLATTKYVGFV